MTLDEMLTDAVDRVVNGTYKTPEMNDGDLSRLRAAELEGAELRHGRQVWGSTAGPYSGLGGSMVTTMTVTMVRVGPHFVCYLNGTYAWALDANYEAAISAWRDVQLPRANIAHAISTPWGKPSRA